MSIELFEASLKSQLQADFTNKSRECHLDILKIDYWMWERVARTNGKLVELHACLGTDFKPANDFATVTDILKLGKFLDDVGFKYELNSSEYFIICRMRLPELEPRVRIP